ARRQHALLPALSRHRARDGSATAEVGFPRRRGLAHRDSCAPAPHRNESCRAAQGSRRPHGFALMAANIQPQSGELAYDVQRVRRDFPILSRLVNGKPLVYLDSAASSQRPLQVIRAVDEYETTSHANVHRGVHALSQQATEAFEGARDRVRRFINARSTHEIIFVRGTTEGINLVAQSYGRSRLQRGDEILISALEHHGNIVPWQLVAEQTGATLKVAPIDRRGELEFDEFEA